jgi:hypothetical protein
MGSCWSVEFLKAMGCKNALSGFGAFSPNVQQPKILAKALNQGGFLLFRVFLPCFFRLQGIPVIIFSCWL